MKKLLLSIVLLLSVACSAFGRLQGKNLQAQCISHRYNEELVLYL